jgi:maltooligosyltrehalose trehalohydrolase
MRSSDVSEPRLGATVLGDGRCRFCVWAPFSRSVAVHVVAPAEGVTPLTRTERGYHQAVVDGVGPGARYLYRLEDGRERPDPASRCQPDGVHQPSQVVDSAFGWDDGGWFGYPLRDYVLYELHVGAFTSEGTFDAVIPRLDELAGLGITAIELMPVAQFPGERNWGYDGVYPFAPQHCYGGVAGLKRLVNACHLKGLAVVLDVVYNHLGPEGNYLGEFGPYFTDAYKTPWGCALNFDGADSDEVRRYFIENALHWITEFHIDALRLDAVHAIKDFSAYPFLEELGVAVHERAQQLNRRCHLIAESDLNDARVICPRELGGYNLDAQWSDDFHHALHALLSGERDGYYADFGRIEHLARAWREAFVYTGQYSRYRRRRHGSSTRLSSAEQFVVCAQNHDQVGNRALGERLSQLVGFEELKLAAGAVLLSPYIPLLFMGEEYGETAPFQYFVSHGDPGLIEAVRRGRREEFAAFAQRGEAPDPQAEGTFRRSKLRHDLRREGQHAVLQEFYGALLALRRQLPALARSGRESLEVVGYERERVLLVRRWHQPDQVCLVFNFGEVAASPLLPLPAGWWDKRFDSADPRWNGPRSFSPESIESKGEARVTLSPQAFCVYQCSPSR